MYSKDGYIINQAKTAHLKYGKCNSNFNGCGWIAAYNIMHACNRGMSADEVRCSIEKGLYFGGRIGTNAIWEVIWLRLQGLRVKTTEIPFIACQNASHCKAGFVLYYTGNGLHFVAFTQALQSFNSGKQTVKNTLLTAKTPPLLRFFNAVDGQECYCDTLPMFMKKHAKFPLVMVATVH